MARCLEQVALLILAASERNPVMEEEQVVMAEGVWCRSWELEADWSVLLAQV